MNSFLLVLNSTILIFAAASAFAAYRQENGKLSFANWCGIIFAGLLPLGTLWFFYIQTLRGL